MNVQANKIVWIITLHKRDVKGNRDFPGYSKSMEGHSFEILLKFLDEEKLWDYIGEICIDGDSSSNAQIVAFLEENEISNVKVTGDFSHVMTALAKQTEWKLIGTKVGKKLKSWMRTAVSQVRAQRDLTFEQKKNRNRKTN